MLYNWIHESDVHIDTHTRKHIQIQATQGYDTRHSQKPCSNRNRNEAIGICVRQNGMVISHSLHISVQRNRETVHMACSTCVCKTWKREKTVQVCACDTVNERELVGCLACITDRERIIPRTWMASMLSAVCANETKHPKYKFIESFLLRYFDTLTHLQCVFFRQIITLFSIIIFFFFAVWVFFSSHMQYNVIGVSVLCLCALNRFVVYVQFLNSRS